MLKKGAINQVTPMQGKTLSNIFLISKKDGRNRLTLNLKYFNFGIIIHKDEERM